MESPDPRARLEELRARARLEELRAKAGTAGGPVMQESPPVTNPEPVDFSAAEMLRNVPSSAGQALKNMATPFLHPIDTAKAFGNTALGAVQKLIPGEQDSEIYADAVGRAIMDRYGSVDAFKKTVMADPVGVAMDLSGIVNLAGGLGRAVTKTGSTANKIAQTVQKVGVAADPVNAATGPVKVAIGAAVPRGVPSSMYQSAAKFPPVSVPLKTRNAITETALNEGIMPTYRGIGKANAILEGLDSKIDDLIKAADATGKTVSRKVIYQDLKALRTELAKGADAPRNLRQSRKIVADLDELMKGGPQRLTPSRLQEFKTATYDQINWRGEPSAKTATLQTLARGARKSIEGLTPEIKAVNQRYGPIAELRDRLGQVANRIENLYPWSLSTGIYGGAGGIVGGKTGMAIGAAASMLNNPKILSGLAIYLRNLQNQGLVGNLLDNNQLAAALRQLAIQSGRLEGLEPLE